LRKLEKLHYNLGEIRNTVVGYFHKLEKLASIPTA